MGIVKTEILPIKDFLRNRALCIPSFQRPYKWSVKNVTQLVEDIHRFKGTTPYRIGTIVVYKEEDKYNIVDGQQRTITFLLMLKAIAKNLQSQELKDMLQDIKASTFVPKFRNDISKKNIQDNYREIDRRSADMDDTFVDFFLNKCEVTHFVIDDVSEAFQFFDSQNARGRDLEPHDLLKAFHLRELDEYEKAISEDEKARLVDTWEGMNSEDLSKLFADFLFRVRGWSKGDSSRYFTKRDTPQFKGINLYKAKSYPYSQIYQMVDRHLQETIKQNEKRSFPFQLDQPVINGKYFFEMVTHYKKEYDRIRSIFGHLTPAAKAIIDLIDDYEGMNRTGDKYVRMLFDCALLYYVDKFGLEDVSEAIGKIFIWAYTPRLRQQTLQLATVDNYVVLEFNLFKKIREAVNKDEVQMIELPVLEEWHESSKTEAIKEQFQKMKYYEN
jgi:hypothetical protein